VPRGAAAAQALAAGLRRQHGLAIRVGEDLGTVERVLTHRDITLQAFACTLAGTGHDPPVEARWVGGDALDEAGLPAAMRALLPFVAAAQEREASPLRGGRNSSRIRSRSRSV